MINSRDIKDLHPKVADLAQQFIDECARIGIKVIITSTYRDHAAQAELYAQGRTKPGRVVTNAKPGQSWHNWRVAFDFAPVVGGKIPWNDAELFKRCGQIGESIGLEWGGRWKSFPDMPHLQYTGGLTLADFNKGRTLA